MISIPVILILLSGIWYSFAWWSRRDMRRVRDKYPRAMKVSKEVDGLLDVE